MPAQHSCRCIYQCRMPKLPNPSGRSSVVLTLVCMIEVVVAAMQDFNGARCEVIRGVIH